MSATEELRIRDATVDDVDQLVRLRVAFDLEIGGALTPERATDHRRQVEEYLRSRIASGVFRVWVAEVRGRLVAMAGRVVIDRPPHPRSRRRPEVFVTSVYTDPAWRGRGLARDLMARVIADARELGARRIELRTSEMGRGVYERLGFRDPGNWMQLDLD